MGVLFLLLNIRCSLNQISMFRKYTFATLTLLFIFGLGYYFLNPKSNQLSKEEYIDFINSHKYAVNRYDISPDKYGKTPDKAYEQDFLRTLDPTTGSPEPQRLEPILKQVNAKLAKQSGVPGSGTTTAWVERGPNNVAGRTRALMYDPNASSGNKVWAGGVTGGLWYNNDITNANSSWTKVNDFWDNVAVSCIAYDPINTQIMYVGTGESYARASRGGGIWKSTNGGTSWTRLSSTTGFYYINDIVVRNEGGSSVVYAAVDAIYYNGSFHGSADAGLQRSTNGGTSWSQVLPSVPNESFNFTPSDIELAADNRIWVGTRRSIYGGNDRGGGRILYSDNGTTWTVSRASSVSTDYGRVEVACAPSDANYVYALVEDQNQLFEVLRTTNKGSTWNLMSEPNDDDNGIPSTDFTRGQAFYDLILGVDPNNRDRVIAGGINLHMTTNGGSTWSQISKWSNNPNMGSKNYSYVHADQHAIVFKSGQSNEVLFGTDGGVFYTNNLSTAATSNVISARNNDYNITQFYACAIHPNANTNYFLAGSQDNGSQQFNTAGINSTVEVNGGDGAFCFIDQTNPTYQITSYIYNTYDLSTNGGSSFFTNIVSDQNTGAFINTADYDNNLDILYSAKGTNDIYRFSGISGSISQNTLTISGMSTMASALYVSPYTTTSTTLFIGTEDGSLFKVSNANGSHSVSNITGTSFPNGSISSVELGSSENEILVTFSNYGVASVWYSGNGGNTWVNKEGNLPDMPVRWGMINPTNADEVILATEVGVWGTDNFTSTNPTWTSSNSGLANVRVDMLQMRTSDNEVIAATHGRGLFSSSGFNVSGQPSSPVANFSQSASFLCLTDSLSLSDLSSGVPSSWNWRVSGPVTLTSTSQNPKFGFTATGYYDIRLIVSNAVGADTMLIEDAIVVGNNQLEVTLQTDNYGSETTWELVDNNGKVLDQGGPYTDITGGQNFTFNYCVPNGCYKFKIYDSFGDGICCANGNGSFQVRAVDINTILGSGGNFTTSDSLNFCLPATGAAPIVDFSASSSNICAGDTVFFTDLSLNSPTAWSWTFPGGNANSLTTQNPFVVYNTPGTYSVSLSATNTFGQNSTQKVNYITVGGGQSVNVVDTTTILCDNFDQWFGLQGNPAGGSWIVDWDANQTDSVFFNPRKLGAGTFNYTYTVSGGNGCDGIANGSVIVSAAPNVSFVISDTLCVGDGNYTFTGGNPSGGIYSGLNVNNGIFNPANVGSGIYAIKYAYTSTNGCSDSVFSNLVIDVCGAIAENSLLKLVRAFPIPTQNTLSVDLGSLNLNYELSLIGLRGELIFQEKGISNGQILDFDLQNQVSGTYYLVIKLEDEQKAFRIIKT